MAPNLITFIGFLMVLIAHLLLVLYSPDLSGNGVPSWVWFFCAFAILCYQILDNTDGKQARKTKTSSPLGMLFDHGCDSLTSWIMGLMLVVCFGVGNGRLSFFAILFAAQVPFFLAMRAQYFIGVFRLSYINGVDEGLVIVEIWFFVTGFLGIEFW
jgi:ethanolaminephosphotransferase